MELEVAMKYCAVGVVVAPIAPLAFAERSEFVMPVRDRTPAFEKLDVALAPNHAGPYELNKVVDACWKKAVLWATMPPKAIELLSGTWSLELRSRRIACADWRISTPCLRARASIIIMDSFS